MCIIRMLEHWNCFLERLWNLFFEIDEIGTSSNQVLTNFEIRLVWRRRLNSRGPLQAKAFHGTYVKMKATVFVLKASFFVKFVLVPEFFLMQQDLSF